MEPQKIENFENEKIAVEVSFFPDCIRKFKIKVFPELLNAEYKNAVKRINKEVSLPGFRKGKAPESVVLEHFKPHIEKEWKDESIRSAINAAFQLTKIYPYSQEAIAKIEVPVFSKNEAVIACELEVAPEVPSIDPKLLKVEKVPVQEVSENEIDVRIEDLCFKHAKWHDVENRGIAEGDYIELDLEILEPEKKELGKKLLFKYTEMAPWMQKALKDKKPGDVVEAYSEKDPESDENVPFVPSLVRIAVQKISYPELPPIDQAFLEKLRIPSIEELRKQIRNHIERQKRNEMFEKRVELLHKALNDVYAFDLPISYISKDHIQAWEQREISKIAENAALSDEEKQDKLREVKDKVKKDIFNKARSELLLDRFFDEHKLQLPEQKEIQEAFFEHTMRTQDFDKVRNDPQYLQQKQLYITRELKQRRAEEKILDLVDAKDAS